MQGSLGQTVAILAVGTGIVAIGALISLYFGRKAKSASDWLAAPESLPLGVVVITQFAAAAGGGVLVAHVGIAYASGWAVFVYEGAVLIGFVLLALIAKWLREQRFTTIPDIITTLFGKNKVVISLAGIAALIVPFGWLGTQFVAFAKLFGQLTGIPAGWLIVLILIGSVAFVLPGGLTSVAWTDFFFGIFKIVMALVVAVYAIVLAGGWAGITARVPDELTGFSGLGAAGAEQSWLWIAAIVPGTLTNQLYYQRVFATKHIRDARRGLVLSGVTIMISGVYAGCIGLAVRAMQPNLEQEQAAGWLLTRLPTFMLLLFGAFLVATIISTSGAALQSVVANLIRDIYQNVFDRGDSDRRTVSLSRLMTVAVALLAGVLALVFPSALDWMVATYAYSAACLAAPIFAGYLLRRWFELRPSAALAGMIAGLVGCAVAQLVDTAVPYAVYGIAASVVVLVIFALCSGRRGHPRKNGVVMAGTEKPGTEKPGTEKAGEAE